MKNKELRTGFAIWAKDANNSHVDLPDSIFIPAVLQDSPCVTAEGTESFDLL